MRSVLAMLFLIGVTLFPTKAIAEVWSDRLECSGSISFFKKFPPSIIGTWKLDPQTLQDPNNRILAMFEFFPGAVWQFRRQIEFSDFASRESDLVWKLVGKYRREAGLGQEVIIGTLGAEGDSFELCRWGGRGRKITYYLRFRTRHVPVWAYVQLRFIEEGSNPKVSDRFKIVEAAWLHDGTREFSEKEKKWVRFRRVDLEKCVNALPTKSS